MSFYESPAMALRAAYLTMHRRFQALFAASGITAAQFVILSLLAEDDGVIQKELVRLSCSDANTTASIVRLLVALMFVRRQRHAGDGRARQVFLTRKGRALQTKLRRHSDALHRRWTEEFEPDEREQLMHLLARTVECFGRAKVDTNHEPSS